MNDDGRVYFSGGVGDHLIYSQDHAFSTGVSGRYIDLGGVSEIRKSTATYGELNNGNRFWLQNITAPRQCIYTYLMFSLVEPPFD